MAHPLPPNVPEFPGFPQTKTLVLTTPGLEAILFEHVDGRRRSSGKTFRDAHAALDWCQTHGVDFLLHHAADPKAN